MHHQIHSGYVESFLLTDLFNRTIKVQFTLKEALISLLLKMSALLSYLSLSGKVYVEGGSMTNIKDCRTSKLSGHRLKTSLITSWFIYIGTWISKQSSFLSF